VHKDFIIDGTGRVVRVGDRVVVTQLMLSGNNGPGVVQEILSEYAVRIRFDSGQESDALATRVSREDDTERHNGHPLWHWS
jgi:hypothetical protein